MKTYYLASVAVAATCALPLLAMTPAYAASLPASDGVILADDLDVAFDHFQLPPPAVADSGPAPVPGELALPDADPASLPNVRHSYGAKTFFRQTGKVGWELAGLTAAITATRFKDVTSGGSKFHVKDEGWFGKNTKSLGMDKMHHAWKTYVFTDVLQSIIANRTGDQRGAATTSAILGLGVMTYAELMDGFTKRTGFSNEDMAVHAFGAGLSLLRNTTPGLRDKIDFRMEIQPEGFTKNLSLVDQLNDRKYLVAVQLSGFKKLERSPFRFVELHAGYYARGFTDSARARGEPLERHPYVGIGFNVQQLFAKKPKSRVETLAKGVFDYVQLPYTSLHN
jgi:hypothetical protein